MNELNKLLLSILLVAAGFMGASLLGPPDLGGQATHAWDGPSIDPNHGLSPLAPAAVAVDPPTPRTFEPPGDGAQLLAAAPRASGPLSGDGPVFHQTAKHDPALLLAASESPGLVDPGPQPATLPIPDWGAWSDAVSPPPGDRSPAAPAPAARGWGTPPELAGPAPGAPWEARQASADPVAFAPPTAAPGPTPVAEVPSEEAVEYRFHVVTDGDTLPSLAQRYLGDPARARELYELNRDRLENPDLLPIGAMLRTPVEARRPLPREATKPVDPWSASAEAGPFRQVSSTPPAPPAGSLVRESRLVPVDAPVEREPAPPPEGEYYRDWSW